MASFYGWERAVLVAIGAPLTSKSAEFLDEWQLREGGDARFNPLNTTQPANGASNYNSVGVKNYPDARTGTRATAQTLLNGRYPALVAALRSGAPVGRGDHAAMNGELGTWGTGGFLDGGSSSGRSPRPTTGRPRPDTSPGQARAAGGSSGGGWGAVVGDVEKVGLAAALGPFGGLAGLFGGVSSVADVLKAGLWLIEPRNWVRLVEFLTGGLLMLLGAIGLGVALVQRSGVVGEAAGIASTLPGPVGVAGKAVSVAHKPRQAVRGATTSRQRVATAGARRDELAGRRAQREQDEEHYRDFRAGGQREREATRAREREEQQQRLAAIRTNAARRREQRDEAIPF